MKNLFLFAAFIINTLLFGQSNLDLYIFNVSENCNYSVKGRFWSASDSTSFCGELIVEPISIDGPTHHWKGYIPTNTKGDAVFFVYDFQFDNNISYQPSTSPKLVYQTKSINNFLYFNRRP